MVTKLMIDQELIAEARRLGGHATDEEAVVAALEHYIRWRKQMQILDHFGTVDYDPDYDHKKIRELDRIPSADTLS